MGQKLQHVICVDRLSRSCDNSQANLLTQSGIGYGKSRSFYDLWMPQRKVLNLRWVDIVTATNNQVFRTTHDGKVALRIHRP
ncbi:hypothetical protein D3C86_1340070 [compost metagenome]